MEFSHFCTDNLNDFAEAVWNKYRRDMVRIARNVLWSRGDPNACGDSEEVALEAFGNAILQAFERWRLARFEENDSLRSYLVTCVWRAAVRHKNKKVCRLLRTNVDQELFERHLASHPMEFHDDETPCGADLSKHILGLKEKQALALSFARYKGQWPCPLLGERPEDYLGMTTPSFKYLMSFATYNPARIRNRFDNTAQSTYGLFGRCSSWKYVSDLLTLATRTYGLQHYRGTWPKMSPTQAMAFDAFSQLVTVQLDSVGGDDFFRVDTALKLFTILHEPAWHSFTSKRFGYCLHREWLDDRIQRKTVRHLSGIPDTRFTSDRSLVEHCWKSIVG